MKERPVMLAAVETVTKAYPVWTSRCRDSDISAEAATRDPLHAASPFDPRCVDAKAFGTRLVGLPGNLWSVELCRTPLLAATFLNHASTTKRFLQDDRRCAH
jgi:hypothetical protein